MPEETHIPLSRLAAFLRQHTHDVRNALNSLELETALLQELLDDPEGRGCVDRIRSQVRGLGSQMRSLSALFQEPQPQSAPIAATELFLIWQDQQRGLKHPIEVEWNAQLGSEKVNVDATMMSTILRELLANAAAFSPGTKVHANARRDGDDIVFELHEPKGDALDPSAWSEPFLTTRRGGYGLGLWSAQRLASANHARISQEYLPEEKKLVSRVRMPVAK